MASKMNFTFSNGLQMPALGIGTWRAPDVEVETALDKALEIGYRHIDAAPAYGNEKVIGDVLKKWIDSKKLTRDELFIVTKLPPFANRASSVEKTIKKSLEDLQLECIDLYLIHCPFTTAETDPPFQLDESGDVVLDTTNHIETWKELERMVELGLTKSIGISNFNIKQIQRVLDNATINPVSLQVELHLYFQQDELIEFCRKNNIIVTAYSSLGSKGIGNLLQSAGVNREIPDLLENEEVIKIGNRLNKSAAQVLLRFVLQLGVAAIPKSTNENRLKQNIDLFDFELTEDDMKVLHGENRNIRIVDFAFFPGIRNHPEFPF